MYDVFTQQLQLDIKKSSSKPDSEVLASANTFCNVSKCKFPPAWGKTSYDNPLQMTSKQILVAEPKVERSTLKSSST